MRIAKNNITSITLHWSSDLVPNVPHYFIVRIIHFNELTTEAVNVTTQHYTLVVEDVLHCDTYIFKITEHNVAGAGAPSDVITHVFHALPDVSDLDNSLMHMLFKPEIHSPFFSLVLTFNVCKDPCAYM